MRGYLRNTCSIEKTSEKHLKLPQVIPIVFYTGNDKWDAPIGIENFQEIIIK